MKKTLALTLALIMLMSLSACSGGGDTQSQADNSSSSQQDESGRSKATEFTFELAAEEERTVENLIFDEDVTISGDFGVIIFENCEFNGDIINTAEQFTRVILPDGTTVNGNCVFKNTTKEATMDYPMPKFISSNTLNIVCEDCIGSVVLESTEKHTPWLMWNSFTMLIQMRLFLMRDRMRLYSLSVNGGKMEKRYCKCFVSD